MNYEVRKCAFSRMVLDSYTDKMSNTECFRFFSSGSDVLLVNCIDSARGKTCHSSLWSSKFWSPPRRELSFSSKCMHTAW